jgi:thioredoxin reductase (NADPH)
MQGLHRLTDEQRDRLFELAEHVSVEADSLIIEEGRPAPGLVLVLKGTVRIEKNHLGGRIPLDELPTGELLGEVSYLLGSVATASAVAENTVQLAIIPIDKLEQLVRSDPVLAANLFRSWAELLAKRLDRRTGDAVSMHWSWG